MADEPPAPATDDAPAYQAARAAERKLRRVSATLDSTPAADGFRMPGEFEPHAGCWMVWPERPDNWRLGAEPAQAAFAAVARRSPPPSR